MTTLGNIKLKRTIESLGDRLPKKNASNQSGGTIGEKNSSNQSGGTLDEGKKYQTPEFVRHCVASITEKPKSLDRVKQKKDGSPFAICHAQYNKNKRGLASKHSQGSKHHTDKQYEKSLATLRNKTEELRNSRLSRSSIIFESRRETSPKLGERRHIKFSTK